jgi:hypothetical protein
MAEANLTIKSRRGANMKSSQNAGIATAENVIPDPVAQSIQHLYKPLASPYFNRSMMLTCTVTCSRRPEGSNGESFV